MRLQNATYSNLEDAFAWEVAMFGIVQKEPRGYWTLSEEVKKTTKEYIMTHVLVPEGTRSLIALDPVEQEYYRAGPDARDNVKRGGDAVGMRGRAYARPRAQPTARRQCRRQRHPDHHGARVGRGDQVRALTRARARPPTPRAAQRRAHCAVAPRARDWRHVEVHQLRPLRRRRVPHLHARHLGV